MRRNSFKTNIKRNNSFTLNITSMTDMFTILLVFLLQNFAASQVNIETVEGLRLPTSNSDKNPVEAIKLSLSQNSLRLDQTTLTELKNKNFDESVLDVNDHNFIKPLFVELKKINDLHKDRKKETPAGQILFQADQEISYATLRKVMYTASMAGFPNVKLITMVGN